MMHSSQELIQAIAGIDCVTRRLFKFLDALGEMRAYFAFRSHQQAGRAWVAESHFGSARPSVPGRVFARNHLRRFPAMFIPGGAGSEIAQLFAEKHFG